MATFKFRGQLLDITENADGSASRLSRGSATLTLKTSADEGFFQYRITGRDGELPDIQLSQSNITSASVNGVNVLNASDIDASLGVVTINGADSLVLAFRTQEDDNRRSDLALFSLEGPDLPNISSASAFNSILGSAGFSSGSGEFAPNTRIILNDLDNTSFTAGVPVQSGTTGADAIVGDAGADNIDAGGGADSIDGGGGADTILGGGGADTIAGGGGSDEINGGGGKDVITGGGGKDTINGGGGKDDLKGGGGKDVIDGGGGRDMVDGQGGRDDLDGGGGKDVVLGGGGSDTLSGGRGVDALTGGGGRDTFEFSRGDGRDTVTDYKDGADKFHISDGASSFDDLTITQVGADARIAFANVQITVEDTDANQLGAGDFLFG